MDGLLGTGFSGKLREDFAAVVAMINAVHTPVVSIDIPSGLSASTGAVDNDNAVRAKYTVTYVALKSGLLTGRATDFVGELFFHGLGIEDLFHTGVTPQAPLSEDTTRVEMYRTTRAHLAPKYFQPRARTAHKGHFGKVVLAGGGPGMPGAIRLAGEFLCTRNCPLPPGLTSWVLTTISLGEACQRTGAGLVRILTHPDNTFVVSSGRPELMVTQWLPEDDLTGHKSWASVLALGPGCGTDAWCRGLLGSLLDSAEPMVLDADALNVLAENPRHKDNWVLTPHPGEAARLLNTTTKLVELDRISSVVRLQQQYGGVILLKGAGTLIADGKAVYIANVGNPGMATGGMGDTLTGMPATE